IGALDELLATADQGELVRHGARVAIVGPPNAGKSTLMNALLGRDRAIVHPAPGTTRDTLEESVNVGGVPFVFVDTAGLRETEDAVEAAGVERARTAAKGADVVLLVLDGSAAIPAELPGADLVVTNKSDLPGAAGPGLHISALTGGGLEELREQLLKAA